MRRRMRVGKYGGALALAGAALAGTLALGQGQAPGPGSGPDPTDLSQLRRGRALLQQKQFATAKTLFQAYLHAHPGIVSAEVGLGDAQLGLHEYEAAELTYRGVVAAQPELWQAHKNLVVVEAALGRWEEFDRERTVLRMARERGAPGISARESDVIDSFNAGGGHWVVRAYFEPIGRSEALYNFERFSAQGRVQAYVSLESAAAAQAALEPGDVRIGVTAAELPANSRGRVLSLNWYTGAAHGTIRRYSGEDPAYKRLRAEVIRWLQAHPQMVGQGPAERTKLGNTSPVPVLNQP